MSTPEQLALLARLDREASARGRAKKTRTTNIQAYREDLAAKAWDEKRLKLQTVVVQAVLDLSAHTGANAFQFDISGTTPIVTIAVGPNARI